MGEGRPSAYADLLAALLAVRSDPATQRFDHELMAAEARGEIDPATARTLRWWQRESLRGLSDHLSTVLPHLLDDLATAQAAAAEAVQDSASSWSAASAAEAAEDRVVNGPEPGGASGSHLRPVDDPGPFRPGPELSGGSTPSAGLAPPRVLRPGFAPPEPGPTARDASPSSGQVAPGAPRHRLIVSGISVRDEDSTTVDLTDARLRPPAAT